jgi:hypothetical protein
MIGLTMKSKIKRRRAPSTEAARLQVLVKLGKMSQEELFAIAVRAGIYDKNGKLTKNYRGDESA